MFFTAKFLTKFNISNLNLRQNWEDLAFKFFLISWVIIVRNEDKNQGPELPLTDFSSENKSAQLNQDSKMTSPKITGMSELISIQSQITY